jgi:hypothetical protein
MLCRFVCVIALALLAGAPSASADGPQASPGLLWGWTGVTAPNQPLRYVTLPARSQTVLASVRRSSGRVWNWRSLNGMWGIPRVANDGTVGGLSRDGRLLFVADWNGPVERWTAYDFAVPTRKREHLPHVADGRPARRLRL